MVTTSLGSATTQMVEESRRGLEQMEQGPSPSVRFAAVDGCFGAEDGLGEGVGVLLRHGQHVKGQTLGGFDAHARQLGKLLH